MELARRDGVGEIHAELARVFGGEFYKLSFPVPTASSADDMPARHA